MMIFMGGSNMNSVFLLGFSLQKLEEKNKYGDYMFNPSLGILSLATWLEFNGYDVVPIDLGYDDITVSELLNRIKECMPILIGLSLYTENYLIGIKLAEVIKENFPKCKIVVGGPHPSSKPEDFINCRCIDFISLNEGECTLLELVEAISSKEELISYSAIPGLIYKENIQFITNECRKKIVDLDLLPIPKRDYVGLENYSDIISVSTSRGCPGRCIYCAASSLSGATYRFRCVENVMLEMIMLQYQSGVVLRKIYIIDDTFTAVPNRVREFADCIKKYQCKVKWHCESRVDVMTEELLTAMKESNCIMIQYGIESGSQEVLDQIKKGINLDQAKKVIQMTHQKGMKVCLSFIVGHFCDTKETMQQTCNFIKECFEKYRAEMAVSFNTPFPGTWQQIHLSELGMRVVTEDYRHYNLAEPVVETDAFTTQDQMNCLHSSLKYLRFSAYLQRRKEEFEYAVGEDNR